MKNELISMVELIDQHKGRFKTMSNGDYAPKMAEKLDLYENYANFLNTPLNISMFVPAIKVGDKWDVLEMPKFALNRFEGTHTSSTAYWSACQQYQTSKDNVIFDGFEVEYYNCKEFKYQSEIIVFKFNDDCYINYNCYWNGFESFVDGEHYANCETIQDLIKYKPTLTKKGLEVSGLNNK